MACRHPTEVRAKVGKAPNTLRTDRCLTTPKCISSLHWYDCAHALLFSACFLIPFRSSMVAVVCGAVCSLQELTVQGASGSEDGTDVRPQCSWTTLRCTDTINEEVWSWFPVPMGKLVVEMLGKDEQQRCIAFPLDTMHEVKLRHNAPSLLLHMHILRSETHTQTNEHMHACTYISAGSALRRPVAGVLMTCLCVLHPVP